MSGRRDHYDSKGNYIGHSEESSSPESFDSPSVDKVTDKAMPILMIGMAIVGFYFCYSSTHNVIAGLIAGGIAGWIGMWIGMICGGLLAGLEDFIRGIFK